MNNPLGNKLYYSISEVAEITDLQPYTLRAWEKEFPCLRPRRARGKNRAYKERDIGIILLIKKLLYEERYTSQGVKKKLKDEPELLRQIGSQTSHLLGPENQAAVNQENVRLPAPEAKSKPKDRSPTHKKVDRIATEADMGRGEFKAVVEEAKNELQEILKLL